MCFDKYLYCLCWDFLWPFLSPSLSCGCCFLIASLSLAIFAAFSSVSVLSSCIFSQTKRLINIICSVSHGIYQSANLVLFWLSVKFGWLSKSFKSSNPFRPFICVGEVEGLWCWDLVGGHRIPLLTPCKVCNSITTNVFKQNVPIYILKKPHEYYNSSTKSKVQGIRHIWHTYDTYILKCYMYFYAVYII